jgi:hypothetical protein
LSNNPKRLPFWSPQASGEGGARQPHSKDEIVASLAAPVTSLGLDPLAVAQVLQDLHQEWTSALPDTWVTNMTSARLVPQLQSLLRYPSTPPPLHDLKKYTQNTTPKCTLPPPPSTSIDRTPTNQPTTTRHPHNVTRSQSGLSFCSESLYLLSPPPFPPCAAQMIPEAS